MYRAGCCGFLALKTPAPKSASNVPEKQKSRPINARRVKNADRVEEFFIILIKVEFCVARS
jgi:hypothetical protein